MCLAARRGRLPAGYIGMLAVLLIPLNVPEQQTLATCNRGLPNSSETSSVETAGSIARR
jgi:hypothetical protein